MPPGVEAIGPYRVLGELGRGANGVVYRAERPQLARQFALKTLRCARDATPDRVARFVREAQAAARLHDHPGIVGVHDVGADDGVLWFAMDLVEGPSLQALIDLGDCTPRRAAELCAGVARALGHAHRLGILHRDLKPANILVAPDGTARVTDFGLARDLAAAPDAARLTESGMTVGTPAYMSPEQARGEPIDGRTDVYGLGATLYEALVGAPPFDGSSAIEILQQAAARAPVPPRRRDAGIPVALEIVTLKCLAAAPADRYDTADELADDLERWLRGEPIVARPPGAWRRLSRWAGRHRALVAASATALLVAGVAAGLLAPRWLSAERRAAESRAQALASLSQMAEAHLEAALALRRVDRVAEMQPHLDRVVEAAREVLAIAPDAAEPYYVVGRMQRALGRDEEALESLTRAIAIDPRHAGALFERIALRPRWYMSARMADRKAAEIRLGNALASPEDGVVRATSAVAPTSDSLSERSSGLVRELERELLTDVELLLPQWSDSNPPVHGAFEFVQAIQYRLGGDAAACEARLRDALRLAPAFSEAAHLLGRILTEAERIEDAITQYDKAIQADQGDWRLRLARAAAREDVVRRQYFQGEDAWSNLEMVFNDLDSAEARGAEGEYYWYARADAEELAAGLRSLLHIEGAPEACLRAISAIGRASGRDTVPAYSLTRRASVWIRLARYRLEHDSDPREALAAAKADLERASDLAPDDASTRCLQATVPALLADAAAGRGESPRPHLEERLALLDQAIRLAPSQAVGWQHRASARVAIGRRAQLQGEDPSPYYSQAMADADHAVAIAPDESGSWGTRAYVRTQVAMAAHDRGSRPTELLDSALADWSAAVERAPGDLPLQVSRAETRGLYALVMAADSLEVAEAAFAAAVQEADAALARRNTLDAALIARALIMQRWGFARAQRGASPRQQFQAAVADASRFLQRRPTDAFAHQLRGFSRWRLSRLHAGEGDELVHLLRSCIEDLEFGASRQPLLGAWARDLGVAQSDLGRALARRGESPDEVWTSADAALTRSLVLDPEDARCWESRAMLRMNRAKRNRTVADVGLCRAAQADARRACELDPRHREWLAPLLDECERVLGALDGQMNGGE